VNAGFFLEPAQALAILRSHPDHRDVIFPYMIGDDLVGHSMPTRWIIDFAKRDQFEARSYPAAFEHVQREVMPKVIERAEREKAATGKDTTRWTRMAERWWQFRDYQPGLMAKLDKIPRYIACSRTTRRPIFEFVSTSVHPDTKLAVVALPDDFSFGIISSSIHWAWVVARCSTWKADFNYTGNTVFDTFPWPQTPTRPQLESVALEAVALRQLRREVMAKMNWSLRDLYRTLEEPGSNPMRDVQARLDTAVRAAYAMPKDADILAFLLNLNQSCAAKEAAGEPITPPGLPLAGEEQEKFVTGDCINA
jgi:hypothetical protein